MRIRIVLADDHHIVRDGLRSLLEEQEDMEVIAEAENGREAVALALRLRPDIVVMDVGMPDLNGIEATRQVCDGAPGTRVVGLSMHSDRRFVAGMLEAGASGYVIKDEAFEELARAIRAVREGRTFLCPAVAGVIVEDYLGRRAASQSAPARPLTPREREVLQLLAEGRSTKQTAGRLGVSVKTVETHRSHIMAKLGIRSVAELTTYAIREGLTSLDT